MDHIRAAGRATSRVLAFKPIHQASQLLLLSWLAVATSVSAWQVSTGRTAFGWLGFSDSGTVEDAPGSLRAYLQAVRLEETDVLLYQHLFALSKEKQWDKLDHAAKSLTRDDLLSWLKAGELVSETYKPTADELSGWLSRNALLPQAKAVQQRLTTIDPVQASRTVSFGERELLGHGAYVQDTDMMANMSGWQRTTMGGIVEQFAARRFGLAYKGADKLAREAKKTLPGARWIAGLSAYHLGKMDEAYREFVAISAWAEKENRNEWLSPSAFWAHRAALRIDRPKDSARQLDLAVRDKPSFYGQLATMAQRESVRFNDRHQDLQVSAIRRPVLSLIATATLLHDIGQVAEAEKLLRHSFLNVLPVEQQALIQTAEELQLADVQLPMAAHLPGGTLRNRYPTPKWHQGLQLDPALVLAIVRRESGFDRNAGSGAGAQGLMQIMPATADYLVKQHGALNVELASSGNLPPLPRYATGSLKNADINLRIGQAYLRHLQKLPEIDGNLIWLLASYNAGPAILKSWNSKSDNSDPLLFVETIPFRETRDYVKNVLTDYWIYAAILDSEPAGLSELVDNRWPIVDL